MHYLPLTTEDRQEMMETLGVEHFAQIVAAVPASLRNPAIKLADGLSELEVGRLCQGLADQNLTAKTHVSFLGAGAYEHFIPSIVNTVISRSEFYTAYTPYQPEASQGTLQAIFEYQSQICELTGMDVSNGSHYDGATSLAEAVLLSITKTGRQKVLAARSLHPEYRQVIRSYLGREGLIVEEIPFTKDGSLDRAWLKTHLTKDVACVVAAAPNFLGLVENLSGLDQEIHQVGALYVLSMHPLSLGFYKTPAEWGADIVCGEGQPLGIPMSFGGPWLGYFAAKRELVRQIPGRLVGMTKDAAGARAFCLTLQAREQHIRRERAASNICTNQALCAVAACVYMAALGKQGIKRVAELNIEASNYLRNKISRLEGFQIVTQGPIFNEFAVKLPLSVSTLNDALISRGFIGGLDLGTVYPELKNAALFCASETKSKSDIDRFVDALKQVSHG